MSFIIRWSKLQASLCSCALARLHSAPSIPCHMTQANHLSPLFTGDKPFWFYDGGQGTGEGSIKLYGALRSTSCLMFYALFVSRCALVGVFVCLCVCVRACVCSSSVPFGESANVFGILLRELGGLPPAQPQVPLVCVFLKTPPLLGCMNLSAPRPTPTPPASIVALCTYEAKLCQNFSLLFPFIHIALWAYNEQLNKGA